MSQEPKPREVRILAFKDAIREAQEECLAADPHVVLIGEGVPDVKAVFGTTAGLKAKFPNQVFDMPVSENGMTGVCIGAALNEIKPILVHMRIDFSLYSADQLINNAAKWFSMFGGQKSVPMVVRMIVGRGWGQGNQHSQNLTALYAHVPGLKIFVPTNAKDAKAMLIEAVRDPNPVLFIEHRWLYDTTSEINDEVEDFKFTTQDLYHNDPLYDRPLASTYPDVTIVAIGHAVKESKIARRFLNEAGVSTTLIAIKQVKPWDARMVTNAFKRSMNLLVVDDAWKFCGLAAEIVAQVVEDEEAHYITGSCGGKIRRLTYPDYPSGSSPALAEHYYNGPLEIFNAVVEMLGRDVDSSAVVAYQKTRTHDVPDQNFRGPF